MTNKFNQVESLITAFVSADGDLAAEFNLVHEKLKEETREYHTHQLPACGVWASGYQLGDQIGGKLAEIQVIVEVVYRGGDLATVDNKVKELASLLTDKFRAESPSNRGLGFSGQAADISVDRIEFIDYGKDANMQFTISAFLYLTIGVLEK